MADPPCPQSLVVALALALMWDHWIRMHPGSAIYPRSVVYANAVKDYGAMQRAITAVDRPMLHNVKAPDLTPLTAPVVCQIKRVGKDLKNDWEDLVRVFDTGMSDPFLDLVTRGSNFWMDFDMMEIGGGETRPGGTATLTSVEQRAHFSLWAAAKSPLVMGNDPRHVPADALAILTNAEVIAVNQDALGAPVRLHSRMHAADTATAAEWKLVLQDCDSADALQQWTLAGDGSGQIRSGGRPGYCAGVFQCISRWPWWISASACSNDPTSSGNGTTAAPTGCSAAAEQHWQWNTTAADADGSLMLEWKPTGMKTKCWGTPGSGCCLSVEGTNPEVDACGWPANASQQQWEFTGSQQTGGGSIKSRMSGQCLGFAGDLEVYVGPLSGGNVTAVLFNRSPLAANITVSIPSLAAILGTASRVLVRDLWAHKDLGIFEGSFTAEVESHGVVHVNMAPHQ
jgi:hypothetical protein